MKNLKLLPLIILILLVITGCAKVVKTEEEAVKATVVDAYHRSMIVQPYTIVINNRLHVQTRVIPAVNRITIKYGDVEEDISSQALYNQYKDRIGAEIDAVLITTYFDNDTTKQRLEIRSESDG